MYFCPMTFKKYTSVLLAFYLLVSTTGLAFNVHHCGDEIASVSSVFSIEEPCEGTVEKEQKTCCAKSTDNHKGCCSDEIIQADLDDSIISHFSFDFDYFSILPNVELSIFWNEPIKISVQCLTYYCHANAPPLYQLHSQFLFYA